MTLATLVLPIKKKKKKKNDKVRSNRNTLPQEGNDLVGYGPVTGKKYKAANVTSKMRASQLYRGIGTLSVVVPVASGFCRPARTNTLEELPSR